MPTVEQRAAKIIKAAPEIKLTKEQTCQLNEALLTLNEAGYEVPRSSGEDDVLLIWRAVELAKAGGVTEEMKL